MTTPPPWVKYQPKINLKDFPLHRDAWKTPLATTNERIAYIRSLVEFYYVNLQEWPLHRRNYNWFTHDYVADNYTFLYGLTNPTDDPSSGVAQVMGPELGGNQIASERAYRGGMLPVPGSLVVIPNENGAYFRFPFSGTDNDGNIDLYWETNYIVVGDQGKITHFEVWADTQVFKTLSRKVYGIDTDGSAGKDLAAYLKAGWDQVDGIANG